MRGLNGLKTHNFDPTQDFDYLDKNDIYLDSACQSLRPRPVLDALQSYYERHNSCGERVKYPWGVETDQKVEETREKVLKYLKLKNKDYFVSFTLNTTYGLNLLLSQIDPQKAGIATIATSDIEHNSPFLSTMAFAERHKLPRKILERQPDGSLNPEDVPDHTLLVVNTASNIDGRTLKNLNDIIKTVHKKQGIIILDAAQAMAHSHEILQKTSADAICFSAHKMYAPSLGGLVVRRDLLDKLSPEILGGGMVDDVNADTYQLSAENKDHAYTRFEPGLQAWGEIIALGKAIDWLESLPKSAHEALEQNAGIIFNALSVNPKIHLLNTEPNPTMSFYVDRKEVGYDSHALGASLADFRIMARTGYFCVHYYLDHKLHLPPLVRFSLGYHITPEQAERIVAIINKI